jgi:hypothetical protein
MNAVIYKLNGRVVSPEEFSAGCEDTLRAMLESRQGPSLMTDAVFLEGRGGGCYDQFDGNEAMGNYYRRVAESHGQDVTGKWYLSSLAAFPGDPRAWVSGRGDVAKVLEERGWGGEGAVSRPVTNVAEVTGGGLASDLADELVAARLASDPGARPQDVREAVIASHAPHWARRET